MTHPHGSWFRSYVPRPAARVRLFCFPYGGGAASAFRGWAEELPDSVELVAVQYPGRQDRFGDPSPTGIPELAEEIVRALGPRFDVPTAFFGHSMGGVVAYEVARRLRPRFPSPLALLVVSACRTPADRHHAGLRFEEDEMRAYIQSLGGSGAKALDDEAVWQLAGPVIRNDLGWTEAYRYLPGAPLTCPITAVAGDRDPAATPQDMELWKNYTIAGADTHVLPGGHFYFEDGLPRLAALLAGKLTAADAPAPAAPAPAAPTSSAPTGNRS
ncbi:thioesterase II family protein [Streptomyces sp. NPDC013157]|uniref:thioesterase II family protein n=1 Tax=Streptomyces sp. NPDC013157 TaxID=3364861 RepID=UPI00367B155F